MKSYKDFELQIGLLKNPNKDATIKTIGEQIKWWIYKKNYTFSDYISMNI